jgi:integrase
MEKDLIPWLGKHPMKSIRVPMVVESLRRIEERGALETAHRVRTVFGQICRYALATGRVEHDISAGLKGALPQPPERHFAAITDPKEVGPLLRAIDGYQGQFTVRCAMKLAPLLFVRPGELRRAEWAEIDLDAALWSIPAEKMKTKEPHIVPLPRQAVEIFAELQELTGASRYVFPSVRSFARPISDNTVNAALRNLGYDRNTMTGHGFRAMARTILDEVLHVNPYVIEAQLAHKVPDPLGRAYNRTTHLSDRQKMMQQWADYLDTLKAGAVIVPFKSVKV